MKKKVWMVLLTSMLALSLTACGSSNESETTENSVVASTAEDTEISTDEEETTEDAANTETQPEESTQESEETVEETEESEVSAEGAALFDSIECYTMWTTTMTATEANLEYTYEEYPEDQQATVVGLLLHDTGDTEIMSDLGGVNWYYLENDEYVEITECTITNTNYACDDKAIVYGRFPQELVDVNNLYIKISHEYKDTEKIFKVDPDNLFDVSGLCESTTITDEKGTIFYLQDVPFMIVASRWSASGATGKAPGINASVYYKTITIVPLTPLTTYEFNFTNSTSLGGNYENDLFGGSFEYAWADSTWVGEIMGTGVELEFGLGRYYTDEERDNYQEVDGKDFFDDLNDRVMAQDPLGNMYIEFQNVNRENTMLYITEW